MGVIAHTFGGDVVWSWVSQFEVAEGILIVSSSLLVLTIADSLGIRIPASTRVIKKPIERNLSRACTTVAALGALSFYILAVCNLRRLDRIVDINGWNLVQYPLNLLGYLGGSAMGEHGQLGYGALALLVWGLTVSALSLGVGFAPAVKFFAVPSVLFLTVLVLLFDPTEMDIQATNLVSGLTFEGISLLSNWSLLTISLAFTVLNLAREAVGKRPLSRSRDLS
jgi:hypothetical protein